MSESTACSGSERKYTCEFGLNDVSADALTRSTCESLDASFADTNGTMVLCAEVPRGKCNTWLTKDETSTQLYPENAVSIGDFIGRPYPRSACCSCGGGSQSLYGLVNATSVSVTAKSSSFCGTRALVERGGAEGRSTADVFVQQEICVKSCKAENSSTILWPSAKHS